MPSFEAVVDSGARQEFSTGSRRDTAAGKGRPHLVPPAAQDALLLATQSAALELSGVVASQLLPRAWRALSRYADEAAASTHRDAALDSVIMNVAAAIAVDEDQPIGSLSPVLNRLSMHFENGARKYGAHNYRKGQPVSRYYDSLRRHLAKAIDGQRDEDHLAAALWNSLAIQQTVADATAGHVPQELLDFPFSTTDIFPGR